MATLDIVIGNGVSNLVIAVSDTTPMIQRAQDATAAINTAFGVTTFKVIWGFRIVAGFNDELRHAANLNGTATNVISIIPAANYASGAALATAMQTVMQAAEDAFAGGKRVDIVCTYNETSGKFNWAWTQVRATISQFIIRGTPPSYLVTALDVVGIQRGADQVGAGANGNMDGDYEVRNNRFKFTFSGAAGTVRLADAAFTAESFFGITDTTNQTILAYLCNLDMLDPAPEPAPPPVFTPGAEQHTLPRGGGGPSLARSFGAIPKSWGETGGRDDAEWWHGIATADEQARAANRAKLQSRGIAVALGELAAGRWLRAELEKLTPKKK
jgi:hypothetical protein